MSRDFEWIELEAEEASKVVGGFLASCEYFLGRNANPAEVPFRAA